jgi:hypothetical protein
MLKELSRKLKRAIAPSKERRIETHRFVSTIDDDFTKPDPVLDALYKALWSVEAMDVISLENRYTNVAHNINRAIDEYVYLALKALNEQEEQYDRRAGH